MHQKPLFQIFVVLTLAAVFGWGCYTSEDKDRDEDGIADSIDNCVAIANPNQEDVDGDDYGDACDVCVNVADPDQIDTDKDNYGDACDVCTDVSDDQTDSDADGYGDACDTCPTVYNPSQANICDGDGDGVRDDLDNCPAVANAVQTNSDGDGVGDDCDPRPGAPDSILFYDGFDGEGGLENSPWKLAQGNDVYVDGQWIIENSQLRQQSITTNSPTLMYLDGVTDWSNIAVEIGFTVDDIPGVLDPYPIAGLVSNYTNGAAQGNAESGFRCEHEKRTATLTTLRVQEMATGLNTPQQSPWNLQTGSYYRFVFSQLEDVGTSTLTCTAERTPDGPFTVTRDTSDLPQGSVGFFVNNVAASFDYIVVYSHDGPAN